MTRNNWACLFLAGLLLTACRGNSYRIKGTTEGIDEGDTLFATMDFETGLPFDTMVVRKGEFELKGRADSIRQCIIYRAHDEETSALLFLEPGTIRVKLSPVPGNTHVSGTRINDRWQQLTDSVAFYSGHMDRLVSQYYTEGCTEEERASLLSKMTRQAEGLNRCLCRVTEENIDNELGYFLLLDGSMHHADRLRLIAKLPKAMREREEIRNLLNHLMTTDNESDAMSGFDEMGSFDSDMDDMESQTDFGLPE